ncbi:MAG: NAD(P)H-hydrate dehydratase [Reinekea sp.]
MNPVLSAMAVRQAELSWAKGHKGLTWPLMERAAQSFVDQFQDQFIGKSVLVVAGPGNNGGDGYLIARILADMNIKTTVIAPLGLPAPELDAFQAYQVFSDSGGMVTEGTDWGAFDVIIDALFGSGLSRDLNADSQSLVLCINETAATVLSVDIPTGLNAQTGEPMPVAVNADATHSFIALKPGLLTGKGPAISGLVSFDCLGVDVTTSWQQTHQISLPSRYGNTHKAQHGQVLVIGGLQDMAGAAIISGQAALNAGAGRVLLHCNPDYFTAAVARAPEMIMARDIHDNEIAGPVVLAGPGLGRSAHTDALMEQILATAMQGVLDADALRYLARYPQSVSSFVLTPHEGEAAALLECPSDEVRCDRVAAVLELSRRYQTTVVLKGAGSLVANQGTLWFCHPGTPKMATPGMGDCLAGIVAALLAQGYQSVQAAVSGVNWHASIAADLGGHQRIVLTSDVIERLKCDIQETYALR